MPSEKNVVPEGGLGTVDCCHLNLDAKGLIDINLTVYVLFAFNTNFDARWGLISDLYRNNW
jgi:hypothetical protein